MLWQSTCNLKAFEGILLFIEISITVECDILQKFNAYKYLVYRYDLCTMCHRYDVKTDIKTIDDFLKGLFI